MTSAAARRVRLVRLRDIEHRIARAASARADSAYAALADVDARVGQMRTDIVTVPGYVCGQRLQACAELATRLDTARTALARSLTDAGTMRDACAAERCAAHIAERRTESFHADACRREEIEAATRAAATRAAATRVIRRPRRPGA